MALRRPDLSGQRYFYRAFAGWVVDQGLLIVKRAAGVCFCPALGLVQLGCLPGGAWRFRARRRLRIKPHGAPSSLAFAGIQSARGHGVAVPGFAADVIAGRLCRRRIAERMGRLVSGACHKTYGATHALRGAAWRLAMAVWPIPRLASVSFAFHSLTAPAPSQGDAYRPGLLSIFNPRAATSACARYASCRLFTQTT